VTPGIYINQIQAEFRGGLSPLVGRHHPALEWDTMVWVGVVCRLLVDRHRRGDHGVLDNGGSFEEVGAMVVVCRLLVG